MRVCVCVCVTLTVGGGESEPFLVQNGLRQGCTLASTLFILYFGLVIDRWLNRCQAGDLVVQFKLGGKLVGERTRILSECLFADDTALMCSSREDMVLAGEVFNEVISEYGLTLSIAKTKLLVSGI